jgi:G3E family GTPase
MDRRDFLKTTTAAAIASGVRTPSSAAAISAQPGLIQAETAKPGASFQLTRMMPDNAKSYRTSLIEGYCSRQSVKAGENLDIFVSTKPSSKFTIEIFRMGYYDGMGSRLMTTLGPFEGQEQPIVVHGVQHIFHPPVPLPAWPSEDRRSRLVFITQDVGRDVIEKTFWAFQQVLPQARESA